MWISRCLYFNLFTELNSKIKKYNTHQFTKDIYKHSLIDDNCNAVDRYGKKEAGTGEHLTHLITLIIK